MKNESNGNDEQLFYIQDTRHYAGDFVLWWRHNGSGYTYNLDEAGLYTEKEARAIERLRGTDKAFLANVVQSCKVPAVIVGRLQTALELR